jgi:peptidoglycan/xylan/chitin deacetylase (PgdA/CDA1 family)
MIVCIFTVDYEIYGNGEGALRELVHEPAERIYNVFAKHGQRFVVFIEVAELEMIDRFKTDSALPSIQEQIKRIYREGHELGLHIHPQWYNAHYEYGRWTLDFNEYNLCVLPRERITQIVDRGIDHFRAILGVPDFRPFSYRAGNWLFQPTRDIAAVLAAKGIRIDTSLYKGGLQRQLGLDYRPASRNGYYWRFTEDVNIPEPEGILLEVPIYTRMVPAWKMAKPKRISLQLKSPGPMRRTRSRIHRLKGFLRFRQPMKLDFTRMTINELTATMAPVLEDERRNPASIKPIVAIGHTKDLIDAETIERFLSFLEERGILVTTLKEAYNKCE